VIATVAATIAAGVLALAAQGAAAAVTTIGGPGVGPGTFEVPGADAVDSSGNVFVLDAHRGTLQKFTNTGGYIEKAEAFNGIHLPTGNVGGIAINESDEVFVADPEHSRLIKLSTSLGFTAEFALAHKYEAVAARGGFVYTLDVTAGQYRVIKFTTSGAVVTEKLFPNGSGPEQLAEPNPNGAIHDQLAVDAGGTVYVTDADNQRVVELNSELAVLGPQITGLTGYAQAVATGTVGKATQVYVGDDNFAGTASVRRFSPAGTLLGTLAVPGAHGALASDESGDVFDSEGFGGGAVLRIDTTPVPSISPIPPTGLASQTVSFSGAGSETSLWSAADYRWDLDGSGTFATDTGTQPTASRMFNAPGTYPIGLRVTAGNGREAQTTLNYVVGAAGASFLGAAHALTGIAVTFDGSPSIIPFSTVADYAWDFDGSGSYSLDGGTSPTISHTFASPGTYTVQLRVTRAGGRVDLAAGTVVVTPQPPPGPVGVSIDHGDYATNDPHVQVDLVWPAAAIQVMLSNDGGFGAAGATRTLALAAAVPWTLQQTGPERLPKTVYVRYLGAGIDTQNFTDDIILDQTPPTLQSASLVGGAGAAADTARSSKPRIRSYRVRVKAQDKLVGVCAVALSAHKSGGSVVTLRNCRNRGFVKLSKTIAARLAARPRYARVRNSAGSWSRWLALR